MRLHLIAAVYILVALQPNTPASAQTSNLLRTGRANHAFDHVGPINEQAAAAAASGATIIYATGLGAVGYTGLPPAAELTQQRNYVIDYNRDAKDHGIELILGYLCATSIVKLESFDQHWSDEFRAQFGTPPSDWRQQDRQGRPLASWYAGDYQPACMNNPNWRKYETFMVRQQLETGHDGIFFDNPTVHPNGCYCPHCMEKFASYLQQAGVSVELQAPMPFDIEATRKLADLHPEHFLQFRSTTARDFLHHIGAYARTLNPDALITCNNSLNSPDRLFAQCRSHGYNIHELSKAEDFVVVEDMVTQPRIEPDGRTPEYGPTYKALHAISHGKPIVAVTLAGDDYHTAPNLMRLAMAEAAAHNASYLSWPTWPVEQRERMIAAVRPQADFLRRHESLLNDVTPRADVLLFLPFRRWLQTDECTATNLAAALTRANIQYRVVSEDGFEALNSTDSNVLLVESPSVLMPEENAAIDQFKQTGGRLVTADTGDWLARVQQAIENPSIAIKGPATVRAVVADQPGRTIIQLFNLNVQRQSSFEDKVTPAIDLEIAVTAPFESIQSITLNTADEGGASGPLQFSTRQQQGKSIVDLRAPRLDINAIVVIEAKPAG